MEDKTRPDTPNDEELRKSQRLLLDAELIGHIGSWEIDLLTGDVVTTEGNRRLFFGDDATLGRRFEDYAEAVHPDDREWVIRRREELLEGTGSPDIEYRIILPSGEVRVIRGLQRVVRDADGRPVRAFGTNTDLTDHKRAEAGRLMLESAISQVDAMIVITDAAGTMQYVNPAFETVTGYTRGEALGRSTSILKSGEHDGSFYRDLWDTISSGKAWKGTFVNKRKDGTRFTEEATISPVFDERGAIVNYVAAKHDRTREMLLESQLRQAQKMESVGRLAGGVAHDFNNMLQVIGSYVELSLELAAPDGTLYGYLEQVQAAVKRSADLTGQLLAFARKQTTSPRVLALNDAVASSLKILQRLIGEDVELAWAPGAGGPSVKMDPTQLYQVLANLAINARDAIAGVGRLTIETNVAFLDEEFCALHPEGMPGPYALLAVSDTGRGMDKETQAHIFEPFFTTKKVGEGTGLGLATVYGIVKQNNGFIIVQSEPGQGLIVHDLSSP